MKEKEAKENQGVRDAGQIVRVPDRWGRYFCDVSGKLPCLGRGFRPNCPDTSKIFDLPRSMRIETRRVCGWSPPDTPKTKQPDTFTHAGLHSHSDGRAVHSQK